MIPLLDMYALLAVSLRALILAFGTLMAGGMIFRIAVLREVDEPGLSPCFTRMIVTSGSLLAASAVLSVVVNSAVLRISTNLEWSQLCGANFVVWGAAAAVGAGMCVTFASSTYATALCSSGCILALTAAVMTSHAVARVDRRVILICLTGTHHIATAAWIGGMPYLLLTLRRITDPITRRSVLRRFSATAMISVGVLLCGGVTMARFYVGSVAALTGTSYGVMLLSKAILTGSVLQLGWLNWRTVRATRAGVAKSLLRLRRLAEAEAGIGATIILAAASLTSSPPAVDVHADRVTPREIEDRMTPRWPRMSTPAFADLSPATPLRPQALLSGSFVPGQRAHQDTPADIAWSEYNHHWAGLIMLTIGIVCMLSRKWSWARGWPLAFLGLAMFLLIRADSENWPLGPRGFWESFQVAEVAMHRVFVLLIVMFAIFEYRVQIAPLGAPRASLVFPLVCAAGGALLLTHSHSLGNAREEFLAELSHLPLAILAVFAGWSRWLQVRLPEPAPSLGWVYAICFSLIGAILLNYREA